MPATGRCARVTACPAQVAVAVAGRPNSRVTSAGACRPAATCPARCRVEAPPAPLAAGREGTLRAWRADRFGNRITEVCHAMRSGFWGALKERKGSHAIMAARMPVASERVGPAWRYVSIAFIMCAL